MVLCHMCKSIICKEFFIETMVFILSSDIYVGVLSNPNQVSSKDYYLGFVSTTVETSDPEAELKAGLDLLLPIEKKFISVKDVFHPTDDGKDSQVSLPDPFPCQWQVLLHLKFSLNINFHGQKSVVR